MLGMMEMVNSWKLMECVFGQPKFHEDDEEQLKITQFTTHPVGRLVGFEATCLCNGSGRHGCRHLANIPNNMKNNVSKKKPQFECGARV
jgi:hypothetical protein